ncbi:MAG TPA: UDP-N-acetylmuramoyl-tripeptide--D-alanyl-D-alanine ligase [Woeseiaceae bacterium]|jgi:UDP-N-acetylmuramoyl-tripeptide--D-alanyl-D-alanine ligase|nr:UDP-N-acetylmuramoyl-tripeptide--D-alanyl-D-alanine ligase [Woeseiaceae bacterium]
MSMSLSQAATSINGMLHGGDRPFDGVSTDTRTLQRDALFFALNGPNFNGSDFVPEAQKKGAAGVVVDAKVDAAISQITVDDTRLGLGRLARAWRDEHDATVVGITGSNGKTTVKELTAACLAAAGPTLATEGNFNNDIGLPLMLMRIEARHRYAVLELGANHVGEIAYLASLARPEVAVITNAGEAHLEGFGSREGIARGKGEILQEERRPQLAVLNADDQFFGYWQPLVADTRVISFGLSAKADIRGSDVVMDKGLTRFILHVDGDSVPVSLGLAGIHNVLNACAAAAVATGLGMAPEAIATALESVRPVSGRLEPLAGEGGATVYDDSYNASPLSVLAAAGFLVTLPGESWIVLGDMKELGDEEERLHAEVGEALKKTGIDRLFTTGDLCRLTADAFGDGAQWYPTVATLAEHVRKDLSPSVNVLVKGSRAMRMERVVDALRPGEALRAEA